MDGYVPDPHGSRSGVTIATGFDLGARNANDLRLLNLPRDLVAKLTPYLGFQSHDAVRVLRRAPLTITEAEAAAIDRAVKARATADLIAAYDAAAPAGSPGFAGLPAAAQTVIASVAFQYGSLPAAAPRFWGLVVARDWAGAVRELRDFGDSYPTRRNLEADLLETVVGR